MGLPVPGRPIVYTSKIFIFIPGTQPKTMKDNTSSLNGFPTDSSPSTQLKYDIVASKFMTGIQNHQKRNTPPPSLVSSFSLIGAVLQGVVALLVLLVTAVYWVVKKL